MARDFDGIDDEVDCQDSAVWDFGAGDFALACWVQTDIPSATTLQALIYKDASGARQFGLGLTNGAGSPAVLVYWTGGVAVLTNTNAQPFSDSGWHHVLGQRVGNTLDIYVDGTAVAETESGTHGTMDATATDLTLGIRRFVGFENPLNGRLAEVAIWGASLAANDAASLARGISPIRVRPGSLKGYWPLYGAVSPEPDFSGNANNGTVTGATAFNHAPVAPPFGFDLGWMGNATAAAAAGQPTARRWAHVPGMGRSHLGSVRIG